MFDFKKDLHFVEIVNKNRLDLITYESKFVLKLFDLGLSKSKENWLFESPEALKEVYNDKSDLWSFAAILLDAFG